MTAPRGIALALVTHESLDDLEVCLPGQLDAARELGSPFIVVDNASRDAGPAYVVSRLDPARDERLVRMGINTGYAAAVNAALSEAPGMDLMLLNPDVEVTAGGICALQAVLARYPRVAVAAPRLVDASGAPQASARSYPSALTILGSSRLGRKVGALRRAYESYVDPGAGEEPRTVDWAIGAALLIRREACDQIGGWDQRYFLYVEDVDFCRRCWQAGWEVVYVPGVRFTHRYERATTQPGVSAIRSRSRRHHIRGLLRLWSRDPALMVGRARHAPHPLGDSAEVERR